MVGVSRTPRNFVQGLFITTERRVLTKTVSSGHNADDGIPNFKNNSKTYVQEICLYSVGEICFGVAKLLGERVECQNSFETTPARASPFSLIPWLAAAFTTDSDSFQNMTAKSDERPLQ